MSDVAIRLHEVSKEFRTNARVAAGLKTALLHPCRVLRSVGPHCHRAVDGVSFEVRRGEALGIIGRNGAGKSTLMGLMSRILRPTSGTVFTAGRICPLLELGVGFTPDLTGRENIFVNGVLLGLRRREIRRRVADIVAFSGLASSIDHVLKTYSSGMQIRLGFSVAVHSDPEILLVDEVLAVGDAEFQERCLGRIAALRSHGVTIVFVSHDLTTVANVCDRVAWIEKGRLAALGTPAEVIASYRRSVEAHREAPAPPRLTPRPHPDS